MKDVVVAAADEAVGVAQPGDAEADVAGEFAGAAFEKVLEPLEQAEADDEIRDHGTQRGEVGRGLEAALAGEGTAADEDEARFGGGFDARGEIGKIDEVLGAELHAMDEAAVRFGHFVFASLEETEAEGEGERAAGAVDEGRIVGQDLVTGLFEERGAKGALAAAHGEEDENGAPVAGHGEGVEAVEAAGIGILADLGEQEQIGSFVDEMGVGAFDAEAAGGRIVVAEAAAAEVEDTSAADAEDHIARGVDGGVADGESVVVRFSLKKFNVDGAGRGRRGGEEGEVFGEAFEGEGGVAPEAELVPVDVEAHGAISVRQRACEGPSDLLFFPHKAAEWDVFPIILLFA